MTGKKMKIGLIDVDGHNFPNLPLMKLSAWHKANGDDVEWWNGLKHYERVYQSKVFTDEYSQDNDFVVMADEVIKGGTGYCLHNALPDDVEHFCPDYGLYGITDTAYGFITRGCPRGCPFCIVSEKDGRKSRQVADLSEFYRGGQQRTIKLLDPNITACKDSEMLFEELIRTGAWIDFTQGLDVRMLTDKNCDQLNRMKVGMIHFAWDNYEFQTYEELKRVRPLLNIRDRESRVYVLTNFNTTFDQDKERVDKLRELGYDPYLMIYKKNDAPRVTRRFQRYVNNKYIFRSCTWEEYQKGEKT